jgi:hypothetical protein
LKLDLESLPDLPVASPIIETRIGSITPSSHSFDNVSMACVGDMKICMITTTCVTLHRLIGAKLDPTDPFSRIRRDSPTNISPQPKRQRASCHRG